MRLSEEQKTIVRQRLLEAAVEVFTEKGFSGATMREISTRAGYSAGTIYSYFPSKERIYFSYFDWRQEQVFEALREVDSEMELGLKESLHAYLELLLEFFTPDREFVREAYRAIMDSPMRGFSELRPARDRFTHWVKILIEREQDAANPMPFAVEMFIAHAFEDYKNLVVFYWLGDESENYHRTSQLIDLSLDLCVQVVVSGILPKAFDTLLFLLKGHFIGNADQLFKSLSPLFGCRSDLDALRPERVDKSKAASSRSAKAHNPKKRMEE